MPQINITIIFVFIIGICIGGLATRIFLAAIWQVCGKLVIDTTRNDKDIYTFHVGVPFEDLPKHKVIRVLVEATADKTGTSMEE